MKMTRLTTKLLRTIATSLVLASAISGCTGTEVGNGLKPKPEDKDGKAADKAEHADEVPTTGAASDSQNAVIAPLEIPLLRILLLQNCGSPLSRAQQLDGILSRVNKSDPASERLFNASVAAGVWTLSDPDSNFSGVRDYTFTPSGNSAFTGQTNLKGGAAVADSYSCSAVTRGALSAVENSNRYRGTYTLTLTKISDSKVYRLDWNATVDSASSPLQAEYQLEQLTINGAEGRSTVFAIYSTQ